MTQDQTIQSIIELRQAIATLAEQYRSTIRLIDEQRVLTETVQTLALSVREQTTELKHVAAKQKAMAEDVEELKQRNGRRWEVMVSSIISTVVGALAGAAMLLLLSGKG